MKLRLLSIPGCLGIGCLGLIGWFFLTFIVAILLPRFIDSTDSVKRAVALDVASQLDSAAKMHEAYHGKKPESFTDFVTTDKIKAGEPYTISLSTVGSGEDCTVKFELIDCTAAFDDIGLVQYYWQDGTVTHNIDAPFE